MGFGPLFFTITYMQLPRKVVVGEKITADWANSVVDFLRSVRPINGVGINVSRTANGTTFSAPAKARPGESAKFPLTAYKSGEGEDTIKVRIRPGMVCGIEPTIGGELISADAAELEVSVEGSIYLFLQLDFEDKYSEFPESVEVVAEDTDSPEDSGTTAYIPLGMVVDGTITNYLSGSLGAAFCSPQLLYWRV